MSRRIAAAGFVIAALAACARIAGLEDSDTSGNVPGSKPGAEGGGGGSFAPNAEGAVISPQEIDVSTACNVTSESAYVAIENTGDHELAYEVTSPTPALISFKSDQDGGSDSLQGTVPAHAKQVVYTHVLSSTPGPQVGEIFVTTGTDVRHIPVKVTVTGGLLALTPPLIDFGQVKDNTTTPPQPVELTNAGTEDVTVSGWTSAGGADFAMSTGSISLHPGDKAQAMATFNGGAAGAPISADFQPQTVAPTCGPPPTLTLKGQRVNENVTVNPGTLGFGDIDCNSAPNGPQPITISNFAPTQATFSVSPTSLFDVNPPSGLVNGATGTTPGTTTLSVNPKPVGPATGGQGEAITINVNSGEGGPRTVTATYNVVGATLTINPTTLSGFGANQTKSYVVTNTGTDFVAIQMSSSSPAFAVTGSVGLYPGGSLFNSAQIDVKLATAASGTYTSTITTTRQSLSLPPSGRLCNTPPTVKASGSIP